jgi:diguanylate cyclase (GGDEF)-like protein
MRYFSRIIKTIQAAETMTIKRSFIIRLLLPAALLLLSTHCLGYPWLTQYLVDSMAQIPGLDEAGRQVIAAAVTQQHLLMIATAFVVLTVIALMTFWWSRQQLYLPLRSLTKQLDQFKAGQPLNPEPDSRHAREFRQIHASLTEISDQIDHQYARQQIMQQSINNHLLYDHLTHLPNRMHLHQLIDGRIAGEREPYHPFALLYLDLDNFKLINDAMGHEIGDELLKASAKRIYASLESSDFIARIGGDEFVVVITSRSSEEAFVDIARRIIALMHEKFVVQNHEFVISTSIGISIFPQHGDSAALLLKHADIAMYEAKEQGRNDFCLFQNPMSERIQNQMYLEQEIRDAMTRREFSLYYQPQVDTLTAGVVGAEALIRWVHPELGVISPVRFIPLAEKTGFILQLGEWVLEEACAMLARNEETMADMKLSINISAVQFRHADFVERVREILDAHGTPPEKLVFEITETLLMSHKQQSLATLKRLKAMGISIAMDDFGTGYSSLAYLKKFPVDIIKIDKTFIQGAFDNPEDYNIIKAIIGLGHELRLKIVAEGVEELYQYDFLRASHCSIIQGYLFSKPLPEPGFVAYTREQRALKGGAAEHLKAF